MKKRIFITGAAGFIGFHLSLYLQQQGNLVLGFDNFNDYYTPGLKRARALELAKASIQVIEGDICETDALFSAVTAHQPTHFVHLAAQAGVRYSLENPQAYVKSNIEGFVNVLEVCRHRPEMPLTYASSSSVYGMNEAAPFSVDQRTDHQVSVYGVTKKTNELLAKTYHHLFGISVTGLRFFTVYGPWGRPDMAYFSFADKIVKGHPIEVFNYGKMQRDFTYIDDIVKGTAAAIDLAAPCEVFNLGNNKPEPLGTLIDLLEQHLGRPANRRYLPMQPGDVLSTYADIGHSRHLLGFEPRTSLSDGIAQFAHWFLRTVGPQQ